MELREACQHRWHDIMVSMGVHQSILTKRHQACPLCKSGKDRFRWTDYLGMGGYICNQCGSGDGFDFLMQYTGKDFKGVAEDIRSIIGETQARPVQNSDIEKARKRLVSIWQGANKLSPNCPTHLYLKSRGLDGLRFSTLTGIRCHPGLDYWHYEDDELMNLGKHPAMVSLVTTYDNKPATLHVTYLTKDGGKAALDPVRKLMTSCRNWQGGAVRLGSLEDGQVLCVAEGIETALTMKLNNPDWCTWACISAGNMEKFLPPNNAHTVYIAADNDYSHTGQAAAHTLAKRIISKMGEIRVSVLMPTKQGHDFNDQLMKGAA